MNPTTENLGLPYKNYHTSAQSPSEVISQQNYTHLAPQLPPTQNYPSPEEAQSAKPSRFRSCIDKIGEPLNKFSNKMGSEAFWPMSMDKECNKATRILDSFCNNNSSSNEQAYPPNEGPKEKPRVMVKIPQKVIQNAVGLAIFTTMRTGIGFSTSGGAGVLIGRLGDGSWSPPSGIHVQTVGVGWMAGLDVYDCIVVINSYKALEAFKQVRVTLGAEISAVAGPVGVGGILEGNADIRKDRNHEPVFTYMKSRGLYAGVQIDGTIIIERNNENRRFYGEEVRVQQILSGQVRNLPPSAALLIQTIRDIESFRLG